MPTHQVAARISHPPDQAREVLLLLPPVVQGLDLVPRAREPGSGQAGALLLGRGVQEAAKECRAVLHLEEDARLRHKRKRRVESSVVQAILVSMEYLKLQHAQSLDWAGIEGRAAGRKEVRVGPVQRSGSRHENTPDVCAIAGQGR